MAETVEAHLLPAEIEAIVEKLLSLAPEHRLAISKWLAASIVQEDIDKAWSTEIARRVAEIESGAVKGVSSAQVRHEIEELVGEKL